MRKLLIPLCFLMILCTLQAKNHIYKGNQDKIEILITVGKPVTLIFPENGIADVLVPDAGWFPTEDSNVVSDEMRVVFSPPNKILVEALKEGVGGIFSVVGQSNSNYKMYIAYEKDYKLADSVIEIKTIDELEAATNETNGITSLKLMKTLIRGDELPGVSSYFLKDEDELRAKSDDKDKEIKPIEAGIIYEDAGVRFRVHRVYETSNGLIGYVIHAMNKLDRPYELFLDEIQLKDMLAISAGISHTPMTQERAVEIIPPRGSVKEVFYKNKKHTVFADTIILYAIFVKGKQS